MQPGEKTRAPLQSRELDQAHAPTYLRLTAVFQPDLTRIGASIKLGTIDASGIMRPHASVIGRNPSNFINDLVLDEPHVSRSAPTLNHHLKISQVADVQPLKHLGACK